ncbi:MAG: MBG domain-containing protein [Kiritimatiellae bacterium]|nr:MBG domain-containing protein [Kiritimatiellia bacterium]
MNTITHKYSALICSVLITFILVPASVFGAVRKPHSKKTRRKERPANISFTKSITKNKQIASLSTLTYEKKIGRKLAKSLQFFKTKGEQSAIQSLKASGTKLTDDEGQVIVLIHTADGANLKSTETLLKSAGAKIMRSGKTTFKASISLGSIDNIAAMPEVTQIRTLLPPRKKAVITSEGVAATQSSTWHGYGLTGAGAKVAVIDSGFMNLTDRQADNEIPSNAIEVNFSSDSNMSDTDVHGSACAEIVYDMAPDAQLYLIKIDDIIDLIAVKNYCVSAGIDIISCSMGWDIINFHDGIAYDNWYTSVAEHPVTAVNQADAAGIFCAFAAGNEQEQQSMISWGRSVDYLLWSSSDDDLNWLYNNDGETLIPPGQDLYIGMTWNQWPLTSDDFNLYLYKYNGSTWEIVAGSEEVQNGSSTSYPMEAISYVTESEAEYAVLVENYDASSTPTFILRYYGTPYPYWWGYDSYLTPVPGSISIPGDAASSFTVGALNQSTYTTGTIEYYSSLGPNNRAYTGGTAVTKPDICAPTGVSTKSYGDPFYGTSSSTPHVAGLAALIKGVYPWYSANEIKQYIQENGFDLGPAGADNTYGSGAALLPTQLAATVTLSNLNQDYDGNPKSATVTTNPDGLTVDLTYDGSAPAPTVLGSYSVIGTINNPPFYGAATNTLTILIDPAIESGALEIATLTTTTGSISLNFNGIPGGNYNILARDQLDSGSWQPIGSITIDGTGTASFIDTNPPTGSRFYMLRK